MALTSLLVNKEDIQSVKKIYCVSAPTICKVSFWKEAEHKTLEDMSPTFK